MQYNQILVASESALRARYNGILANAGGAVEEYDGELEDISDELTGRAEAEEAFYEDDGFCFDEDDNFSI